MSRIEDLTDAAFSKPAVYLALTRTVPENYVPDEDLTSEERADTERIRRGLAILNGPKSDIGSLSRDAYIRDLGGAFALPGLRNLTEPGSDGKI